MIIDLLLLALAGAGHAAISFFWLNRIHATALPRWIIQSLSAAVYFGVLATPILVWMVLFQGLSLTSPSLWNGELKLLWIYVCLCWGVAVFLLPRRFWQHYRTVTPEAVVTESATTLDWRDTSKESNLMGKFALAIPGNQAAKVEFNEKTFHMPGLAPELEGISIVHLSDLHFTGRLSQEFFRRMTATVNDLAADLVVLSGDLVEVKRCMEWIPDTLGQLRGNSGVYFIVGNHDRRVGAGHLRSALSGHGLFDLGGRWMSVPLRGTELVLAGNELPWFVPAADVSDCPPPAHRGGTLRVLVSHSPDQIHWARRNEFDLMLAGHTHGGQIRVPFLGAVVSPSRYGFKYASGTFHLPPTLMHVSRGIAGEFPLRYNCPPEITRIILTASKA